ncbi:ATP-binding protein [Dendronalium sp. ChiSLP03b]|uniref:sensor histidine kinase n=1 Tax=Dendronalium sp. ChiSLP03b TaxID=3075381 RepID=UPI002AD55A6B|nr:ATP-binding protein [Dendronalium sp. ChiSLP03b]MDZ8206159.1 ATP-binding protein [Dendronalium sp. ChiSLP03b]
MTRTNQVPKWYRIFFSVRTRILVWYVVLMCISAFVSILAIRHFLYVRMEQRIEKSLQQEIAEFRLFTNRINYRKDKIFENKITFIFEIFINRNIPDDDEFLVTLLNGKIYRSSPKVLPSYLKQDSELAKYFAQLTKPEQNQLITPTDTIVYRAEPIIQGQTHGVFVVAQSTLDEQQEVNDVVIAIMRVTIAVVIVSSLVAWIVAGRVLSPLHLLTETARSITESDLTRSIPVKGSDEIAELTITFNEMLQRLQAAFAIQRDFINDAGHELRTPITIIRGHLELLGDDPQERQETIELVTDELDRMNRFVDDLLLLVKAEQPDFLNLETLEISSLTEELYAKAKALAVRDWRLESVASCRIVGDRQRLTQAIMNLAQNATQYTKQSDIIALGSAAIKDKLHLWVRDTGEGIPLSDQKRIFQRFARGSGSRRRSEGAGLGLSIVRAIAESHGGKVELVSRALAGSTFTLIIPLEPPHTELRSKSVTKG